MLPAGDINQEDIATALKAAGSTRKFIDRQDYVTVLKELGDDHEYVDDQDIPDFILGLAAAGGGMFQIFNKQIDLVGLVNGTPLITAANGYVGLILWGRVLEGFVGTDTTSKLQVGFDAIPSHYVSTNTSIGLTPGTGGYTVGEILMGNQANVSPSLEFYFALQRAAFINQTTIIKAFVSGTPLLGGKLKLQGIWVPIDEGAELVVL